MNGAQKKRWMIFIRFLTYMEQYHGADRKSARAAWEDLGKQVKETHRRINDRGDEEILAIVGYSQ